MTTVTGERLRQWLAAAEERLGQQAREIDRLNVFPVPDGDTGHNMLATLREARAAAGRAAGSSLEVVARAAADGAMLGARGNSGMILSQLLRGMQLAARGREAWDADGLAEALQRAAEQAYAKVYRPVEGTVLTVARAMAAAARGAPTVAAVLAAALEAGWEALAGTRDQLPALRRAGVVDAGARGWLAVVEAWALVEGVAPPAAVPGDGERARRQAAVPVARPYDVEALLTGPIGGLAAEEAAARLEELGDSVVVAASEAGLKVHVHTDRPAELVALLAGWGGIRRLELQDMRLQMAEAARAEGGLRVAGEARWAPVLAELGAELAEPAAAADGAGWIWALPGRGPAGALAVPGPALAALAALHYDPGRAWGENRRIMAQAVAGARHYRVWREPGGWRLEGAGPPLPSRADLADRIAGPADGGPVTVYIDARSSEEERTWWESRLNAVVVPLPPAETGPWLEIVVESGSGTPSTD